MRTRNLSLKFLSFLIITLLITSCATNGVFTSRKYTAGNYKESRHKALKTQATEQTKEKPVYASTENGLNPADLKSKTEPEVITAEPEIKLTKKEERQALLKSSIIHPFKEVRTQIKDFKKAKQLQRASPLKKEKKASSDGGIDHSALMSLILSGLAIICDVIGIALVVGTLQYGFILFFIVGLALGITGLVMGTRGIKNYRDNNGSPIDLIFSIIGTVLGGISIILSVYYSIWSLLWISVN